MASAWFFKSTNNGDTGKTATDSFRMFWKQIFKKYLGKPLIENKCISLSNLFERNGFIKKILKRRIKTCFFKYPNLEPATFFPVSQLFVLLKMIMMLLKKEAVLKWPFKNNHAEATEFAEVCIWCLYFLRHPYPCLFTECPRNLVSRALANRSAWKKIF